MITQFIQPLLDFLGIELIPALLITIIILLLVKVVLD